MSVDPKAAKNTLLGFRECEHEGYTLTENTTGTAAVNINDAADCVCGNYVNIGTRLTVDFSGQGSADDILETLLTVRLLYIR